LNPAWPLRLARPAGTAARRARQIRGERPTPDLARHRLRRRSPAPRGELPPPRGEPGRSGANGARREAKGPRSGVAGPLPGHAGRLRAQRFPRSVRIPARLETPAHRPTSARPQGGIYPAWGVNPRKIAFPPSTSPAGPTDLTKSICGPSGLGNIGGLPPGVDTPGWLNSALRARARRRARSKMAFQVADSKWVVRSDQFLRLL
jgi:hypothetical protein